MIACMIMKNIWDWKVFIFVVVILVIVNGIGWYPVFLDLSQSEVWNTISFGISFPAFVIMSFCLDQACRHDFWFNPVFFILALVVSPMVYAMVLTFIFGGIIEIRNRLK